MLRNTFVYAICACLTVNTNTLNSVQEEEETQDMQPPAFNDNSPVTENSRWT